MYSPLNHDNRPRVRWGDASYGHQVYVRTTEPMPSPSNHQPRHPVVDFEFHKGSDDKHVHDVPRAHMMGFEHYGHPRLVKTTDSFQIEEDVDQEAEDFIAIEHKKFACSRTGMPTRSG